MDLNKNIFLVWIAHWFPIIAACALIFRSIIPFQFELFFILITLYYGQLLVKEGLKSIINQLTIFLKKGFWYLLIASIYLLVIAVSGFKNDFPLKEAVRVLTVVVLVLALALSYHKMESKKWYRNFNLTYLFYLLLITCILLFRMVGLGESIFKVMKEWDYNMLAMYFLVGIVLLIHTFQDFTATKWKFYLLNIFLFILVGLLFLTASRRGIIGLSLLCILGFIYTLYSKTLRFWFQKLALFWVMFFAIFLSLFFIVSQPAIRKYLVFENPENVNVKRINGIFNRYFSIINKSGKTIPYFHQSLLLNNQIAQNLTHELTKDKIYNQKYYNTLHHLAYFKENKEQLFSLNSDLTQLNDSVFENQLLPKLPAYFNVDYSFDHWFVPIQMNNCILLSYDLNVTDSVFHFKNNDYNKNSLFTTLVPVVDSSIFTLEFYYYSNDVPPVVSFNLPANESNKNPIIHQTVFNEGKNRYKMQVVFETTLIKDGMIRASVQFNTSDFYTSDFSWSRKRNSKNVLRCNTRVFNNIEWREAELDKLLPVTNRNDSFKVTKQNLVNLHEPLLKGTVFNRYKNAEIISSGSTFVQFIKPTSEVGFVKKIIPAIPGFIYVIRYQINSPLNVLNYNLKRYPESNPEFLKINKLAELNITETQTGLMLKDSFEVTGCSSLRALLVIGSGIHDTIKISDLDIKVYPGKSQLKLDQTQLRHAFNLNNSAFNTIEKLALGDLRTMNLFLKDSLQRFYGFIPQVSDTLLASTRAERWKFAWFYFKKLPVYQKLFGDQLAYLDVYPKVFYSRKAEPKAWDYPHNPVISAYLYSGIIGGLLYLLFLFTIVMGFIKYRDSIGIYMLVFLIAFAFAFFSGNSHFSIPLFAILSFFPFFDFINKTSEQTQEE